MIYRPRSAVISLLGRILLLTADDGALNLQLLAGAVPLANGEEDQDGDERTVDAMRDQKKPKLVNVQDPGKMLANAVAGPQPAAKGKPKKGARKGKNKKGGDEDDERSDDDGAEAANLSLKDLKDIDPDLYEVAKAHKSVTGKLCPVFFQLEVKRYLHVESENHQKLTANLTGASCSRSVLGRRDVEAGRWLKRLVDVLSSIVMS